jgi:hypothetical protein
MDARDIETVENAAVINFNFQERTAWDKIKEVAEKVLSGVYDPAEDDGE